MDEIDELKAAGATMLDVRTQAEWDQGHVPGSLHIPLDQIQARIGELDPDRPLLVCCASGARSGMVQRYLMQSGFARVVNAGPWQRLL
ncbi:MAG TPA: rhodanese-like domain-containing protein [Holophaga sp.]|nr:rhodanese-like domain-containing protein [Holophaga sp.]